MDKSTVVTADKLLCDDKLIGDYVKMTLPDVNWKKDTLTGAGIAGDFEFPLFGLPEAMKCQIDMRSVGKSNAPLVMKPGVRRLEARFNRNVLKSDGSVIKAGTKVFLSVMSASLSPGTVQRGAAMDGNASFSVLRFRWVEDGKELFNIDVGSETVKVGGVDYSDRL